MTMRQSALLIEVPEAEPSVARWRAVHDPIASRGIPAHITVLFPFMDPAALEHESLEQIAAVTRSVVPFEFTLTELGEFPGCLWLRPIPEEPFQRTTAALHRVFPAHALYGGKFSENQPHLTVAQTSSNEEFRNLRTEVDDALGSALPINCVAEAVSLFTSDTTGMWRRHTRFAFEG